MLNFQTRFCFTKHQKTVFKNYSPKTDTKHTIIFIISYKKNTILLLKKKYHFLIRKFIFNFIKNNF